MSSFNLFLTSPMGQLTLAAVFGLFAALAGVVIKRNATAAYAAQVAADLVAALDPFAGSLTATGVPLFKGFAQMEREAKAWLDSQGIKGSARDLLEKDLPALIGKATGKALASVSVTPALPPTK
jgi:hypothetical protein